MYNVIFNFFITRFLSSSCWEFDYHIVDEEIKKLEYGDNRSTEKQPHIASDIPCKRIKIFTIYAILHNKDQVCIL